MHRRSVHVTTTVRMILLAWNFATGFPFRHGAAHCVSAKPSLAFLELSILLPLVEHVGS